MNEEHVSRLLIKVVVVVLWGDVVIVWERVWFQVDRHRRARNEAYVGWKKRLYSQMGNMCGLLSATLGLGTFGGCDFLGSSLLLDNFLPAVEVIPLCRRRLGK